MNNWGIIILTLIIWFFTIMIYEKYQRKIEKENKEQWANLASKDDIINLENNLGNKIDKLNYKK